MTERITCVVTPSVWRYLTQSAVPSSLLSSLEGQNYSVFQAALTGGKYNSVTFRVSIVKNSARYETGSLYHRRSGALR
jgi:hypothetical protein